MKSLTEMETRGGNRQELDVDAYGRMVYLAMEQLLGNLRTFLNYRAEDEQCSGRMEM